MTFPTLYAGRFNTIGSQAHGVRVVGLNAATMNKRVNGHGAPMTKEQTEAVDLIIAQHVGQCTSNPDDELALLTVNWSAEAQKEARLRLDENVFYCEGCSWYCEADERHDGDLCDDCHDEEHKYDDAPEEE